MNIKDLVKNTICSFTRYKDGNMFYIVYGKEGNYEFPVPLDDIGAATLNHTEKSLLLMRYIRKAIADKTIRQVFVTSSTSWVGDKLVYTSSVSYNENPVIEDKA